LSQNLKLICRPVAQGSSFYFQGWHHDRAGLPLGRFADPRSAKKCLQRSRQL